MKKHLVLFVALLVVLVGCQSPTGPATPSADSQAKSVVYASFYPIADFVKRVRGDAIDVKTVIKPTTGSHDWEPSAKDMAELSKAHLLFFNGAGFEGWIDQVKSALPESARLVDTSSAVELIDTAQVHHAETHEEPATEHDHEHDHAETTEGHDHDHDHAEATAGHDHDHDHGTIDPHTWLSLKNAVLQMDTIRQTLSEVYPDHADAFQKNFDKAKSDFEVLDQRYQKELAPYAGRTIVVPHQAFGYLCRDYQLVQRPLGNLTASSDVGNKQVQEMIEFTKTNAIKTIYFERGTDPGASETIAKEIGGKTLALSTIEMLPTDGDPNKTDFLSLFEENLEALLNGFN